MLKKVNNDYALAFRFLYLCSYIDYDGVLKFEKDYMTEKDFSEIFLLNRNKISELKKQLYKLGLIQSVDLGDKNIIIVTKEYAIRSNLKREEKKDACRVFNYGLQSIYKSLDSKEHKTIGKILPLLEFMHVDYNILCKNPNCKLIEDIKSLNFKEIAEIMGVENTGRNHTKVINKLMKIKIGNQLLFDLMGSDNSKVVVNPKLFYKGNKIENIKWLTDWFTLRSKEKCL